MSKIKPDVFKEDCPIAELTFTQWVGRYTLSIKAGNYYEFSSYVHSNQNHYHDSYELVMVIDGYGEFEHQGITKHLTLGDIYISAPYQTHEIHIKPSGTMRVFYMFFQIKSEVLKTHLTSDEDLITNFLISHSAFLTNNKDMLSYIQFIDDYGRFHRTGDDPWLSKHITNFLLQAMERLSNNRTKKTATHVYRINTLDAVLDYIDSNIEKPLTGSLIAEEANISRRMLYLLFQKHLNKPVHSYIKERKIEFAKHYLLQGVNITEVTGLMGFSSLSYFSKLFKEIVGVSPKQYVQNNSVDSKGIGRRINS